MSSVWYPIFCTPQKWHSSKASLCSPFLAIVLCSTSALAARFDVTNRCADTVWAAAIPIPGGGGRQLNPGVTWNLNVAAGTSSARIWGWTKCQFDGSGRGRCQTGDCGGVLRCQNSGAPPATLAEFTLNGNLNSNTDYFDISVIDGFNIPMEFSPTSNCGRDIRCLANNNCPDAYHQPNDRATFSCPSGTNYRVVFYP